jgi:hypothetical protein
MVHLQLDYQAPLHHKEANELEGHFSLSYNHPRNRLLVWLFHPNYLSVNKALHRCQLAASVFNPRHGFGFDIYYIIGKHLVKA